MEAWGGGAATPSGPRGSRSEPDERCWNVRVRVRVRVRVGVNHVCVCVWVGEWV